MSTTEQPRASVVHVVEAWGGGVQAAVRAYTAATVTLRHHLVVRPRPDVTGDAVHGTVEVVEADLAGFLRTAAARVRALRPDVVHLHSSYAGLLRARPRLGAAVVYTPHAYAFLREDLPRGVPLATRVVERALARVGTVAACSPYEAALAERLGATRVVHVPNPYEGPPPPVRTTGGGPPVVVMVGRVSPQKDPGFLAACAARARAAGRGDVVWRWVGGGDPDLERGLREAGVEVTGWLPRADVPAHLADVDLMLHTAAWDAAPMALLEVAGWGVPILVRRRPYADGLGLELVPDDPAAAAAEVLRVLDDAERRAQVAATSRRHAADHSLPATAAALLQAYGLA